MSHTTSIVKYINPHHKRMLDVRLKETIYLADKPIKKEGNDGGRCFFLVWLALGHGGKPMEPPVSFLVFTSNPQAGVLRASAETR